MLMYLQIKRTVVRYRALVTRKPRVLLCHPKRVPPSNQSATGVSAIKDTAATDLIAKVSWLLARWPGQNPVRPGQWGQFTVSRVTPRLRDTISCQTGWTTGWITAASCINGVLGLVFGGKPSNGSRIRISQRNAWTRIRKVIIRHLALHHSWQKVLMIKTIPTNTENNRE